MIKTLYEIMTPTEFVRMGRDARYVYEKELSDVATDAMRKYQLWQMGPLNEQTQQPFIEAVERWKKVRSGRRDWHEQVSLHV